MIRLKMHLLLVISIFIVHCASMTASSVTERSELSSPFLRKEGRETVSAMSRDQDLEFQIYEKIKKGDKAWLRYYPKLRIHSDAGISMSLDQSLGLAILNNPHDAIIALNESVSGLNHGNAASSSDDIVRGVCGAVSVDFEDPQNPEETKEVKRIAVRELEAKQRKVSDLLSRELKQIVKKCHAAIGIALDRWKKAK